MSNFLQAIAKFRYLIVIAAGLLVATGISAMMKRSPDLLPEFTPPTVEVQIEALGLSAEEVESLITIPMEADLLNGIAWIESIRSQSLPGLSSIVMVFEDGADIWETRQLVQERLTQAHALPNVSSPPVMLQPTSSTSRVMQVGLFSDELSNIEISVQAHWNIRPRLMGVPGVANVSVWGMRNRQLQVLVDPAQLHSQDVSLHQVLSSVGNSLWFSPLSYLESSAPGSGGFIDTPNQRLAIRHVQPISTPEDFEDVSIEGSKLTLGEVATIVEDHQPLIGDALVGGGDGLMLVIEKFPWADTLAVTRGVEQALDQLRPSLPGVNIDTGVYRRADFIDASTKNILWATLVASVLLLGVIAALRRNWKTIVVTAVTIPASMISAMAVLYLTPFKPDIVMIAGLVAAIGLVINDATASAEALTRPGDRGRSIATRIAETFRMSRGALLLSTLVGLSVSLPLLAIDGVSGAVAQSLVLSFTAAVAVSAIVSVTLVPALWSILTSPSSDSGAIAAPARLPEGQPGARASVGGGLAIGVVAVLALVTVGLTVTSQRALPPTFNDPAVLIDWQGVPGTSRIETVRVASNLLTEIREIPGVLGAGAHVGRAITSDSTVNVNSAQFWVNLDPEADRADSLEALGATVSNYPGVDYEILNYSDEKVRDFNLPHEIDTLRVRIFGYEFDQLDSLANRVRETLQGSAGDRPVTVEEQVSEPVIKIEADLERSKSFGIKPGDIRRTAAILLSGLEVGSLFEDQKVFKVVLWGVPEIRNNITAISDILIDAPGGGVVRLNDVADVSIGSLPNVIHRDAVSRYRDVIVDVSGADVGAAAREIEARLAGLNFPLEYHAELLPDYLAAREGQNRLVTAIIAAMAAVLLLVQAAVGSWRLGAAICGAIFASAAGGTLVMAVTGNVLSAGALIGLIGILAIAARLVLGLVSRYQALERDGSAFGPELVAQATRDHSLDIATVVLATAAALLPAAVMGAGNPGMEILTPLARVMVGGLITVALVSVYLVPALYLRFGVQTANIESDLFSAKEGQANV